MLVLFGVKAHSFKALQDFGLADASLFADIARVEAGVTDDNNGTGDCEGLLVGEWVVDSAVELAVLEDSVLVDDAD
jgi:hypothetical protein